jgi:hypothetical protein
MDLARFARCWGYERETPHPIVGNAPVKMKAYVAGGVWFQDGALVTETVKEIKTQITNTLIAFKPEF